MIRKKFSIEPFNVRGLTSNMKNELLNKVSMFVDVDVDVCCLQEPKIKNGVDMNNGNNLLMFSNRKVSLWLWFFD